MNWTNESAYWPDDPICGASILQLTSSVGIATNIYCEDPACSPNNKIVLFRSSTTSSAPPTELIVADIESGRLTVLDDRATWNGAAPQAYGELFFYPRFNQETWELCSLNLVSLEISVLQRYSLDTSIFRALGSASPKGLITSMTTKGDSCEVFTMDAASGQRWMIASGPDFFNPHPRFDRMQGEWVLVQHNRGQHRVGGVITTVNKNLGTTLVLCRYDGSERQPLPIAQPFVQQEVSGHEAWVKDQPAFLYSSSPKTPPYDDGERCGNLLLYRIGDDKPSVVAHAPNLYFGHVSTSACGRYWCCDAWHWPHDGTDCCRHAPVIYVGCIETRKFAPLCEVGGVWPRYENGHSHPYLSADNRYAIFTSTRHGFPQVYRATLPEGFLDKIS